MRKAVANVNGEIAATIVGREFETQRALDEALIALDGTPTKSRLGANALLGVSMAAVRAEAASTGEPLYQHISSLYHGGRVSVPRTETRPPLTLPTPMMNILNGGAHADTSVDVQEFMVMPVGAPSFAEALRVGAEIFHALRGILKARGQSTGVGDEGGFAPNLKSNRDAIEAVLEAVAKAGMKGGEDVFIALDVAASELWAGGGSYAFKKSGEPGRTSEQMVRLYDEWLRDYPIISIEDGIAEGDWEGWQMLTRELGGRVQLVGDDVFVTNPEILKRGVQDGVAQRAAGEAQPDRHRHRDARRGENGTRRRLRHDHFPPIGRDRGHDDRGPRGGDRGRPNQDRIGEPHRPRLQIQPTAAHRRGAGERCALRRPQRHPDLVRLFASAGP